MDQWVLKMERRAKELFVGKIDQLMWGSEVDYKIGESSLADRCISYHDIVVEAQRDTDGVLSNRAKTDDAIAPDGSLEHAKVGEATVPEDLLNRVDTDKEVTSADLSERTEIVEDGLLEGSAVRVEKDDDILLKEALGRARQYLSLCNVGGEGAEQLRDCFQGIVDRYYEARNADVCTQAWIPILSFFMSYFGVLVAVFDDDPEGKKIVALILPIIIMLPTGILVAIRRKKWKIAFSEGNLRKLMNVVSDLTVYLLTDEKRLHSSSGDDQKDTVLGKN